MDTSWKNWLLTMGGATVATLAATGHTDILAEVVDKTAAVIVWIITTDLP